MSFKVGLMGASPHTGNRGVSALGASLVRLIWQSRPDATISLLIGHRNSKPVEMRFDGRSQTIGVVNYRLSPRAALGEQLWWIALLSWIYRFVPSAAIRTRIVRSNAWIRSVAEADFVGDIRGGDSFSDIYGAQRFFLGGLPVLSVIWIRGGIHLLPQTYGPFRSKLAGRLARYIFMRAESIWCRDRVSLEEVARLTRGRRTGTLCPDVAFALEPDRPEPPAIEPPLPPAHTGALIGINVSGLMYYGGYTRSNMFGLRLNYPSFLKRLVEALLEDPSHRVLLTPHTFAADGRVESDPSASRELIQAIPPALRDRVHLVVMDYDQHRIKGVIGMCDFFIGSRMHACIAALSQGITTAGVAYSRKFAGVFEMVGAADWVIDGRTECDDAALTRVLELFHRREANRTVLQANVAAARGELSRNFDAMLGACLMAGCSVR